MALTESDVARLNDRAKAVGATIGRELAFIVAPNPEYVGVTSSPGRIFVLGPSKLAELAVYDIEFELDALERGDRRIVDDEDGDPRLI